jgi:hypothetical protein
MTETSSRPAHPIEGERGLFAMCPDCASRDLFIDDHGPVVFACLGCDSRWRYSLGFVWRVGNRKISSQMAPFATGNLS